METLNINVNKYYTDVNGTIISKLTIPSQYQVAMPVFLLGKYDMDGAYRIGHLERPPLGGMKFFKYFVNNEQDFLAFTGANTLKNQLSVGDQVFVYTDDLDNPNFFFWITISSGVNYQSIASVINAMDGSYFFGEFLYVSPFVDNYKKPIAVVSQKDKFGVSKADDINPLMFKSPYNTQEDFVRIKFEFQASKYIGLYTYMDFENDEISFNFYTK